MWPSRDIAWSTGPKNCSLFTLDLIAQSSLCIITNYIYSWSSSWWAAMQLLRRHQDSWLTMVSAMSANNSWRKRSKYARSLPSQTRFLPTLEWGQLEQDSGWGLRHPSGSQIRLFPFWASRFHLFKSFSKSGYFIFEPWDFICSNLFQPSGPEDVEQGEPDQPDHHVDGEGGVGGEGGDVRDDAETAAGLHFFSLTKSTGLFSCCNLLFLFKARSDHTPLQPWCLPNGPSLSQAKREGLLFLFRQELQGQVK